MACCLVCELDETGSNPVGNMLLDVGWRRPFKSSGPCGLNWGAGAGAGCGAGRRCGAVRQPEEREEGKEEEDLDNYM